MSNNELISVGLVLPDERHSPLNYVLISILVIVCVLIEISLHNGRVAHKGQPGQFCKTVADSACIKILENVK